MPFGGRTTCVSCECKTSELWRKTENKESICNTCFLRRDEKSKSKVNDELAIKQEPESGDEAVDAKKESVESDIIDGGSHYVGSVRKSARLKPTKNNKNQIKSSSLKGRSRRTLCKKTPVCSTATVATISTKEYIFHEGCYMQVGDIVSVIDEDDGTYFAQVRGFLEDQYGEKSVVITWLVPTVNSPKDRFDASTYILGPEEDLPRSLEYFSFVCHAPSDYFKAKNAPYPTKKLEPELGYISTSTGFEVGVPPSIDEVFGMSEMKKNSDRIHRMKNSAKASRRGRRIKRQHMANKDK